MNLRQKYKQAKKELDACRIQLEASRRREAFLPRPRIIPVRYSWIEDKELYKEPCRQDYIKTKAIEEIVKQLIEADVVNCQISMIDGFRGNIKLVFTLCVVPFSSTLYGEML